MVELGLAVVWPWEMLLFSAAVPAYIMFDCLFILELHFAIFFLSGVNNCLWDLLIRGDIPVNWIES